MHDHAGSGDCRLTLTLDVNTGLRYSEGMSSAAQKRIAELRREAIRQGWRIIEGRHLKWLPPDREAGIVVTARTPSDHRAIKNIEAELRRHGLELPEGG